MLEKNVLYRITLSVHESDISSRKSPKYILDIPYISGVKSFFDRNIYQDSYAVPLALFRKFDTHFYGIYHPSQLTERWNYVYYIKPVVSGKYTIPPAQIFLKSQPQIQSSIPAKTFIIP